MNRCERCQPLILDHLYGLLDEPEEAFVEAHLRDCPTCAAARDESARVQGLFATAARGAFPQVRFEAPTTTPAPNFATPTSTVPARSSWRVAAWLPWAVAAAVWLAIPGTVLPVLGVLDRARTARSDVEQSVAQLEPKRDEAAKAQQAIEEPRGAARRELAIRSQQLDAVLAKWLAAEKASVMQARKTPVEVLRPASFQPGAPNDFDVVIRDGLRGGHSHLTAEVHEVRVAGGKRSDAVIFSQPLKPQQVEPQPLRLPASAWTSVTPESELYLVVTSTDERTRVRGEVQERIRLYGPVYSTMLVTDKPAYRPGEMLYFRSLTLDRASFRPPEREQKLEYELYEQGKRPRFARVESLTGGTDLVRVSAGKVEPVVVDGKPIRGVGCGAFALPANLPDGDYSLVLHERPHPAGYPPAVPTDVVRPIKVQAAPGDLYRKRIGFSEASFAAGDAVNGWAELQWQGQPVAGAEVHAIATADNVLFDSIQSQPTTGPDGRVNLHFTLPKQLERGDVRLQVMFKKTVGKETVQEVVTNRVPVVGRSVLVEFFPEGGYLIAGLPCRVYFRATTPAGQPVDIKGTITDGRKTIAKVETLSHTVEGANRGIGSFTYTPTLDTPVWLKLDAPPEMHAPLVIPDRRTFPVAGSAVGGVTAAISIRAGFLLPVPRTEGVAMTVLDPVTAPGQPIRVHLRTNGNPKRLVVGAYTRGRLADTKRVTLEPNQVREAMLMASADPRGGVVRVTVFEEPADDEVADAKAPLKPDLKPVAERLVFRKPGEALNLSFTTRGQRAAGGGFAPGSAFGLDVAATDEKGRPAAAVLYAAVVNSGVAPGPKDRLLTTHFLLAGEITTPDAMEFADFLLSDHPKAGEVLDLVLATQGWRRFAEQTHPGYVRHPSAPTEECKNLLVTNGQYSVWTDPAALREQRELRETYWPLYERAEKARDEAQRALSAANADRSGEEKAAALAEQVETARAENRALAERAAASEERLERFRTAGWYGVAGFGLLACLLGATCLARPAVRLPLGIGTVGALGLAAFLIFALGTSEPAQAGTGPVAKSKPAEQPAAVPGEQADRDSVKQPSSGIKPPAPPKGDPPAGAKTDGSGSGTQAPTPLPAPRPVGPPGRTLQTGAFPFRHPLIPRVERQADLMALGAGGVMPGGFQGNMGGRGAGIGGGMVGGSGISGGMGMGVGGFGKGGPGGGGFGGVGFFGGGLPKNVMPPAPAPQLPGGIEALPPHSTLPLPSALPKIGPMPKSGFFAKRYSAVPNIPLVDAAGPRGPMQSAMTTGATTYSPQRVRTPGLSLGRSTQSRTDEFKSYTDVVRMHTETRAKAAAEQMLGYLAQRQGVPVEALNEALTKLEESEGYRSGIMRQSSAVLSEDGGMRALLNIKRSVPRLPPLVVREYAAPRPGSPDELTPDTVLWQPVIVLPADGKTTVPFHLGHAPGGYQVIIAGHTLDGRLGAVRGIIPVAPVEANESSRPAALPGQPAPVPPPAP